MPEPLPSKPPSPAPSHLPSRPDSAALPGTREGGAEPATQGETDAAVQRAAQRGVDVLALQRIVRRLSSANQAPWLHGEVARRMAQRLPIIRMQPEQVLDWWSFSGDGLMGTPLEQIYPKAQVRRVEPDLDRCQDTVLTLEQHTRQRAPWWSRRRWRKGGQAAAVSMADRVPRGGAQLLWANMNLHAQADPQAVLAQWQAALAVDGFVMFSTLGPGSLVELQALYRRQGWPPPFAPFVDMHDLGDMLVQAGFADPVMDQEILTLTWATPQAALDELRQLGGNAHCHRSVGLRTPRWRLGLLQALAEGAGADGRISLSFEVVYGHAFKPLPRPRVAASTVLAADDLQRMARATRRPAPTRTTGLDPSPGGSKALG